MEQKKSPSAVEHPFEVYELVSFALLPSPRELCGFRFDNLRCLLFNSYKCIDTFEFSQSLLNSCAIGLQGRNWVILRGGAGIHIIGRMR